MITAAEHELIVIMARGMAASYFTPEGNRPHEKRLITMATNGFIALQASAEGRDIIDSALQLPLFDTGEG